MDEEPGDEGRGENLEEKVMAILNEDLRPERRELVLEFMGHDQKAGTYNERRFRSDLASEVERSQSTGKRKSRNTFSLLYIDVDKFKYYNDVHGHATGDLVIKAVGTCLKEALRPYDREGVYHLHGDEFAVLIQDTSQINGLKIAERLKHHVETTVMTVLEDLLPQGTIIDQPVTISVGLYNRTRASDNVSIGQVCKNADAAMYLSKVTGKVELFNPKIDYGMQILGVKDGRTSSGAGPSA
ncbi:MAG: GGDEF domain-containing protein [archaeon]